MKLSIVFTLLSIHFFYHEAEAMNKDCLNEMKKIMERQTKLIVPCIESLGLKTGAEKKEKALCVMKCVMIKAEMLAPDGSVDLDLAQKMMNDLPDALKDKAADVIQGCGHHAATMDPNDASCESYREFTSCLLDISLSMCRT